MQSFDRNSQRRRLRHSLFEDSSEDGKTVWFEIDITTATIEAHEKKGD